MDRPRFPRDLDLAAFASLKDRDLRADGLVVGEGRLLATRLLAAAGMDADGLAKGLPRPRFEALGLLCVPALEDEFKALAQGLCPVKVMGEGELAGLAGFPFHRGVLAAARRREAPRLVDCAAALAPGPAAGPAPSRLVVLPATIDPENLGSIMRSAAALGWDGLVLGPGCCDHLSRRALRVSMGAGFSLPVLRMEGPGDLGLLAETGWSLAAAVLAEDSRSLRGWEAPARLALLIGNEFEGLGPEWLGPAMERLNIPMDPGSDSLNAAAAAAVFLYEAAAKR